MLFQKYGSYSLQGVRYHQFKVTRVLLILQSNTEMNEKFKNLCFHIKISSDISFVILFIYLLHNILAG